MLPRNPTILRDATDTPSPNPSPLKRSNRKHKLSKENAPPTNYFPESHSPSKPSRGLPPRPPPNPLKRKINVDAGLLTASSDSGVKVCVYVFFIRFNNFLCLF